MLSDDEIIHDGKDDDTSGDLAKELATTLL
jgi:hypothetical protein